MTKRLLMVVFAFLAVAGVRVETLAAQDATPSGNSMMTISDICNQRSMAATPSASGDQTTIDAGFDLAFIDLMVAHHEDAIAMATIARERAQHEEVSRLAASMIEQQQGEIAQLLAWRAAWFPGAAILTEAQAMSAFDRAASASPGMGGVPGAAEMMGSHALMDLCGANEKDFDLAFLRGMIAHHQGALLLAQSAIAYAEHQELMDFSGSVVAGQQAEIDQMNAWLVLWYPDASPSVEP